MDFLNKSFAQLTDLFRSMTPGARITTVLLLVVVVMSVCYLFIHSESGPDVFLLEGTTLSNPDLHAIEAALGTAGLPYELDGSHVRVPRGRKYEYMAAISAADALPKGFGEYLERAVANQSVFSSSKSSEQRQKIALQMELAKIVSKMDGIESAAVLFDENSQGGFRREKVKTASVSVMPLGSRELDASQANAIGGLMLGSIAGMKAENVRIINLRNGRYLRINSKDLDGTGGTLLSLKRQHEKEYKAKILEVLDYIPGVIVSANVELTQDNYIREEAIKHDPKTIVVQSSETTSSRTSTGAEPSGRPGYVAQTNAARGLAGGPGKGSEETQDDSEFEQTNALSGTRSTREIEGHQVTRVVASISVPSTYFEKLWRQKYDKESVQGEEDAKPAEPDETQLAQIQATVTTEIQNLVAQQLQLGQTKVDPSALVQVGVFSPIAPDPLPQPSLTENAVTWLGQSWRTLGLIGLGFFSLLMIRSMAKASVTPESGASAAATAETDGATEEESPPGNERKLTSFGTSGKSLKEELSELVTEDPDTAATILRNWIGNVSSTP